MIAAWVAELPAFLVAIGLLIVPGLPAALLLRLRGVFLLGGAVVISLASIAAASLVAPVIGLRWSTLPVLLIAALISIVAGALWIVDRARAVTLRPVEGRGVWWGLGAAMLAWAVIVILGIRSPEHPTQLYDGLFHLNAVEFILRHGDASPFHMTMVVPDAAASFYPTLWHALVSLVTPVTAGIVQATNVVSIVVVAVIWPVSLAVLTSVLFPGRGAATWTPVLALGFAAFPLGFLNWGVLYPNLLGTAQVPLVVAFVGLLARRDLIRPQRVGVGLLVLAAAGSTALGHPSALLAAVALLVPYGAWWAWERARAGGPRVRVVIGLTVLLAAIGLTLIWREANVTTREWLPTSTIAQALGEVALLSPVGRATGLLVGALAVVGILEVVRARQWWILASHAVATGLYLASAWLPVLPVRSALVGVWYDDTTRVAALLAMFGLPLAGLGLSSVIVRLREMRARGQGRRALVLSCLVLIAGATHLNAVTNDLGFMRNVSFRFDADAQGLTPDEVAVFEQAQDLLDDGDKVIGDPLTGAALLYAYTGHDVVFPHVTGKYGPEAETLALSLNEGGPTMCTAIRSLGVTYALDFGDRELFENHYTTYDGLHGLSEVPFLTEVVRNGDAALYRVTGC